MISLFFRLAIGMLVATLLTLMTTRFILDTSASETSLALLHGHIKRSADQIAQTPPAERREAAKNLSEELGYGVRLEEATGDSTPRSESRSGDIYLVARVPNNPGQIVFGPIPFRHVTGIGTVVKLAVLFSCFVSFILTLWAYRRIRTLEVVAAKMRDGDFSARAKRDESDAFDSIGASLNQLADRVGQLLNDERDLLRTVAHEVRTPIARMHFRVENIKRKIGNSVTKDSKGLVSDLEQVDNLFEELLTYVGFDEFDQDRPDLQTTNIDLRDAVCRVVEEVTATSDVQVTIPGSETTTVIANQKLFDRATTNLLLNAMAYGGGTIRIEIRVFEGHSVVDVQDSGPGIPENDRPKVIKPFVRLAKKKKKGTGLGLAIVSRIMRLHGGELHLLNAPNGGASVQLVWRNSDSKTKSKRGFGLFRSGKAV